MSIFFREIREIFKDQSVSFLDLTYEEDVLTDPMLANKKILDFLGLKNTNASVRFSKTNAFPIGQMISNMEEVSEHLSGTNYSWMLEN